MISTIKSGVIAAAILTSACVALPAPAATAAPTCKVTKYNFDELARTNGFATGLPGEGYDYKGLAFVSSQWRYVSSGLQYNGDSADNDRPVPHPPDQQQSNITPHSGINALMQVSDGPNRDKNCIDSANYAGGHRYYDLKSFWIAGEYANRAFTLHLKCRSYNEKDDREKFISIPPLAEGAWYQVKVPSDWVHMWRCEIGSSAVEEQIILDDIEVCLWDFPYSQTIPW